MGLRARKTKDEFVRLGDQPTRSDVAHVMLVPGSDVSVLALELPRKLRGHARETVARRQIQDRFHLDEAHIDMRPLFAPGQTDSWTRVMISDRAALESWRKAAHPKCRAVLPSYLGLPIGPGIWTIETTADAVTVRLAADDGFATPPDLAGPMLERALVDAKTNGQMPKAVLLSGTPPAPIMDLLQDFNLKTLEREKDAKALDLPVPKRLASGELEFDLRRNPMQAKAALERRVLPWRWPLFFGAIAAGLWAATQSLETRRISDETAQLNRMTEATVRQHFVPSGPILDARVQVNQALSESRGSVNQWQDRTDPLDLLNKAAQVLHGQSAETETIIYSGDETLLVTVRVRDFATTEQLITRFRDAALTADVVENRTGEEGGVRSTLRLQPQDGTE